MKQEKFISRSGFRVLFDTIIHTHFIAPVAAISQETVAKIV